MIIVLLFSMEMVMGCNVSIIIHEQREPKKENETRTMVSICFKGLFERLANCISL